jgi:hypothetical protein
MNRNQAWEIVCEFVKSESLRKHMLAVQTCVSAYAVQFGEDEEKWAVTALLHDFDWEIHPAAPDHPMKGEAMLAWTMRFAGPFFLTRITAEFRVSAGWKRRFMRAMSCLVFSRPAPM